MKIGICFGAYSPLHQGHLDAIMRAKKECDRCFVVVCGYDGDPRGELIPLNERYHIVRNFLNDDITSVISINDTDLGLDESMSDYNWRVWMSAVCDKMLNYTFEFEMECVFYVGEKKYADAIDRVAPLTLFAQEGITVLPTIVIDRTLNPISGTECRANPIRNWNRIALPFRPHYTHRILVAGTASEGKTTLVHDIGRYFGIPYSYEKGRDICHLRKDNEFDFNDFMYNLTEQNRYNEELVHSTSNNCGIFISDTDNIVTLMYALAYCKRDGFAIDQHDYDILYECAKKFARKVKWDKVFLVKPKQKPIVDDGERYMQDSPYEIRDGFYKSLKKLYDEFGYQYEELDGTYHQNFLRVKEYINSIKEK